jgi:hypothetical protein
MPPPTPSKPDVLETEESLSEDLLMQEAGLQSLLEWPQHSTSEQISKQKAVIKSITAKLEKLRSQQGKSYHLQHITSP